MIKAIIFDFYGVLRSDDYHDWLVRNDLPRDSNTQHATKNLDSGEMSIDEFFESLAKFSKIPADEIRKDFVAHASLNKQLLGLILELKSKFKIGLLSNASSSHLYQILSSAGVDKLFDEVVVSSDIGHVKPSREIFDYALDRLGIEASEAVFIDDTERFVQAAEELGIKGIVYKDFDSLRSSLEQMGIINS